MPPKYQASFERLYDEVKPLDFTKSVTKKKFMELIATFLKDEPIDKKKESIPVEPIPVDLPELKKKKRATARKQKVSDAEEGEAVAQKKTVIAPAPVPDKKSKKTTSAKKAKNA